jgi:hypothetical protein
LTMKFRSLIAILFAVANLVFPQITKAASDTTAFDGTWSVTQDTREFKNPDGSVARAWTQHFFATVKNGVLHGERGTRGAPGWFEFNGNIDANGMANISANGVTREEKWNKGPAQAGTPYEYQVTAQFKGRNGSGKSTGPRMRIFTFVKD